mmetsp:Transcript_4504/g.11328  ORF Transcript_4504/g.11328 Transcript_4504/m.11328 type:complete len:205 (-) Transcript_4504:300-914(-)
MLSRAPSRSSSTPSPTLRPERWTGSGCSRYGKWSRVQPGGFMSPSRPPNSWSTPRSCRRTMPTSKSRRSSSALVQTRKDASTSSTTISRWRSKISRATRSFWAKGQWRPAKSWRPSRRFRNSWTWRRLSRSWSTTHPAFPNSTPRTPCAWSLRRPMRARQPIRRAEVLTWPSRATCASLVKASPTTSVESCCAASPSGETVLGA